MEGATAIGGGQSGLVAPEDTVPPQVKWEPEHRKWNDKFWGILYALAFAAYLGCGFTLVAKAHARWDFHQVLSKVDEVNGIAILEEVTVRTVSQYFYNEAVQCCGGQAAEDPFMVMFDDDLVVNHVYISPNLCHHLTKDHVVRRKLQAIQANNGFVSDDPETNDGYWASLLDAPPDSKFEQGDGMFVSKDSLLDGQLAS
jgi:hypothetical protein